MPRRRFAYPAIPILALGAVLATSAIGKPIQEIDAKVTPAKGGSKSKPRHVATKIVLTTRTDTAGEAEPTTTKAEVFLPSEFIIGAKDFKSCTAAILNDQNNATKCPAGSRVGIGRATMRSGTIQETLNVTAYNGPKGKSLLVHLRGTRPVNIDQAMEGKLQKAGMAGYGQKLVIPVPQELQEVAGLPIALTDLTVTIKGSVTKRKSGKSVKIPYFGIGPCTDGELNFRTVHTYKNLTEPGIGEDTVTCT